MALFLVGLFLAAFGLTFMMMMTSLAMRAAGMLLAVAGAICLFGSNADPMSSVILLALISGFGLFLFSQKTAPVKVDDDEVEAEEP